MTLDENTGFVRCSSRSIPEVHIRNVIADNESLFEYFGGHSQAAGLVFDPKKSPFEKVKSALIESTKQQAEGKEHDQEKRQGHSLQMAVVEAHAGDHGDQAERPPDHLAFIVRGTRPLFLQ